jgi:hypothetical protein
MSKSLKNPKKNRMNLNIYSKYSEYSTIVLYKTFVKFTRNYAGSEETFIMVRSAWLAPPLLLAGDKKWGKQKE